MSNAEKGNKVKVHYTGTLTSGDVFDSSANGDPLEFTLGSGEIIPGFDTGVTGMTISEKKTITIPADEAYGQRNDELIMDMPVTNLPEGLDPQVGQQLQMVDQENQTFIVVITNIKDDAVTLDANHPLAGEDLTFEIELMEIVA